MEQAVAAYRRIMAADAKPSKTWNLSFSITLELSMKRWCRCASNEPLTYLILPPFDWLVAALHATQKTSVTLQLMRATKPCGKSSAEVTDRRQALRRVSSRSRGGVRLDRASASAANRANVPPKG
jgi:hypothetical protein